MPWLHVPTALRMKGQHTTPEHGLPEFIYRWNDNAAGVHMLHCSGSGPYLQHSREAIETHVEHMVLDLCSA